MVSTSAMLSVITRRTIENIERSRNTLPCHSEILAKDGQGLENEGRIVRIGKTDRYVSYIPKING